MIIDDLRMTVDDAEGCKINVRWKTLGKTNSGAMLDDTL